MLAGRFRSRIFRRKAVPTFPQNALGSIRRLRVCGWATKELKCQNKTGGRGQRPVFTDQEALLFHSQGRPGKLEIVATKPMATQRDLSLAYSPGVAVPVLAIAEDQSKAYDYTTKGNLVAVISNGTAILGLGNLGALAAKPVMEGKAVLFKRFADIDSIDLEVDTEDPDEFINCVRFSARASAASTSRTSRRRSASSSSSGCASCSTSRSSTTTSTAPPSSPPPACINALDLTGRDIKTTQAGRATAPAPPASPASSCSRRWASRPRT